MVEVVSVGSNLWWGSQVLKVGNHWNKPREATKKTKQSHFLIVCCCRRCRCTENLSADVWEVWCAARVNYSACELEHLLSQITPELIFLRVLSLPAVFYRKASHLWLSFSFYLHLCCTPTAMAASTAADCGRLIKAENRDRRSVFFFSHVFNVTREVVLFWSQRSPEGRESVHTKKNDGESS